VDRFANVLVYPKVYKSQITRFCFLALTLTSFCQIFLLFFRMLMTTIYRLSPN
jgi:hypothetical protein